VPVILAVGMKEVAEPHVSVRRLGEKESRVLSLDAVAEDLRAEATPPRSSAEGPGRRRPW
jgi:threonyl-tRNA synthetase